MTSFPDAAPGDLPISYDEPFEETDASDDDAIVLVTTGYTMFNNMPHFTAREVKIRFCNIPTENLRWHDIDQPLAVAHWCTDNFPDRGLVVRRKAAQNTPAHSPRRVLYYTPNEPYVLK